jgi:hypothetical protein
VRALARRLHGPGAEPEQFESELGDIALQVKRRFDRYSSK